MRKYNWVPPVVVALALVGFFVVRPWYRDRQAAAAADALIADLRAGGEAAERDADALPPLPDPPAPAEREAYRALVADRMRATTDRMRELRDRAEVVLPGTPEPKRQELRDALAECTARFGRALEGFKRRADQLRAAMGKP